MWSVFEREVNKHPHNTMASLSADIWDLKAGMARKVVFCSYKKFWSRIKAVVGASGVFIF
jgi:hypothetical protein